MRLASLLLVAAAAGPALAQTRRPAGSPDAPDPPPPVAAPAQPGADATDPTRSPGFPVIDRLDGSSRIGLDVLGMVLDEDVAGSTRLLLHAEAHARYVNPATGLGVYAQLPFSYLSGGNGLGTRSDFGDPEIGAIFAARAQDSGFGAILHAGITLPLGESSDAAGIGTAAGFLAMPAIYSSVPGGTTLKIGVSPVLRSGSLFARLDFGFDWNLSADDATVGKAFHVNAGVGVDLGNVSLAFESENTTLTSDNGGNGTTLNALAASLRFTDRGVSPYGALTIPIDEDLKGITVGITAGLDVRL